MDWDTWTGPNGLRHMDWAQWIETHGLGHMDWDTWTGPHGLGHMDGVNNVVARLETRVNIGMTGKKIRVLEIVDKYAVVYSVY